MFFIQDPLFTDSKQLLDAILECCSSAQSGAGAYAFVSSDGVNLLIGDPIFTSFLARGQFQLIIGMDEITNTRSLVALRHFMDGYPNLQVKAFLHDTTGSTFHPKFCWFDCSDFGYVITGSGNLTQKGMQRNREAFELRRISPDELETVIQYWNTWLQSVSEFLRPLEDEAVIQKAEENTRRMQAAPPRRTRRTIEQHPAEAAEQQADPDMVHNNGEDPNPIFAYVDDEFGSWEFDTTSAVLISEIPRGNNRWNQANFDAGTFRTYFESTPGVAGQMALILRDVKCDGSLGEIRHRPPVSVASHNYRVELSVARGTTYPNEGRVLGVFVKLSSRTFLYSLIFPTDTDYPALQAKLDSERQRRDRLVRYQTTAQELQRLAPSLPILYYLS